MQSIDRSMTAGFTRMIVVAEARSPTLPPPCSWSSRLSISEIDAPPLSKELKKRRSYFIRKVYETDALICPKCQGEMWFDKLTTLRELEGRIIIKKFFNTL